TAPYALEAEPRHQARHRAPGSADPFTTQLAPDFAHAIHLQILVPDTLDFRQQLLVALGSHRKPLRVGLSSLVLIVTRRRNRQLRAQRFHAIVGSMQVDERSHHFGRRSSSAWAKKAEALRKISLARFSSRFSRSSSLSRSRSNDVTPLRLPWSVSA